MIKKLKIGLLSLAALLFALTAGSASAANLNYNSDTIVNLTGPAINVTIVSGSAATSVVVAPTTLTVTVPASSTFTLTSPNRYTLTNDSSLPVTCTNSASTVTITGSGQTVVFTPSATLCSNAGGGALGGGGGGGGAPADTTPPVPGTFLINNNAATTSSLAVTLTLSATDNVGVAQMMIANNSGFTGASWQTYATTLPWTLTSGDGLKTVYAKYRDAAGNVSTTATDTITVSGSGTVAVVLPPSTTSIVGCTSTSGFSTVTGQSCADATVTGPVSIPGCNNGTVGFSITTGQSCANNVVTLTVNNIMVYNLGTGILKNGSKGAAVKELQRLLNKVLNLGLVLDGRLGPKTIAVIKTWQKNHGLVADGLVGPKTKAAMKAEAEK